MSITRAQYAEAMEATDAIAVAANLIMQASVLLDRVPSRFMAQVEAIDGSEAVSKSLAQAFDKLADRIALDADAASEQAA